MKNAIKGFSAAAMVLLSASAVPLLADEGAGNEIAGWRVSAGGNMGFGLRTKLRVTPGGISAADAQAAARAALTPTRGGGRVDYGNGAYVDPVCNGGDATRTWNWRLPASAVTPVGADPVERFRMSQAWSGYQAAGGTPAFVSDKDEVYGASVDFSRLLYAAKDGSWGVDLVLGLQYLKRDNCFRDQGRAGSMASGREYIDLWTDGPLVDPTPGSSVGYVATGGLYGPGQGDDAAPGVSRPSLRLDDPATITSDPIQTGVISAHGDYDEWEISLLLRPWYDVTDWWRLRGAVGMGLTRSEFEYSASAILAGRNVYSSRESFDEWRLYGLAGVGTSFCWKSIDIGFDCLFRFCQDDMDINGRDVNGTLEKPDLVLRISLGYSF